VTRPPSCRSELRFAALLQYSPDGKTEMSQWSREHTRRIKRGSPAHIERIGLRSAEWAATGLADFFGEEVALVPVPRSKPFKDAGALWPGKRIAEELARRGLGGAVLPLLERKEPIEKSALQRAGSKRPGPEDHIRTIAVVDVLQAGRRRIVLVDDVVTRGATLLGCATLLQRVLPDVEIVAFAAVRTMSGKEIEQMLAPVTGTIRLVNGRPHREP
jgi:hypothetical protein